MDDPRLSRLLLTFVAFIAVCCTACSEDAARAIDPRGPRASATETRPAANDEWVVMTWNLEWFFDNHQGDNFSDLAKQQSAPSRDDWNWRRDAVADSIARVAPDILAVQEIEGQRALFYLTGAIERRHQIDYSIGFTEGGDYFTEQDVGFLLGPDTDLARLARYQQTRSMDESGRFHNVSKHAEATVEVPVGDSTEKVTLMTVHLRAGADGVETRTRQARLVHTWLAERIAAGENVIVLGDVNSSSDQYPAEPDSDIAALSGRSTQTAADDLVDLGEYLPSDQRSTHLHSGKHLDRILVSRSLMEDDPKRPDLVFAAIERQQDLAIRGRGADSPAEHWDRYWQMPEAQRDLSDHWPLVARFMVK